MFYLRLNNFNNYYIYFYIILGVFIAMILIINYRNKIKLKENKKRNDFIDSVYSSVNIEKTLEENLMNILKIISNIVFSEFYAFFVLDDKNKKFVLRVIRNGSSDNPQIRPSYSGLLPYKKETFSVPHVLPLNIMTDRTMLIKEGEVPLLIIPLKKSNSLILVGPVKNINTKTLELLELLIDKTNLILNLLFQAEELKEKVKITVSSGKAVKNISNIFNDYNEMTDIIFRLCVKSINASAGVFIEKQNGKNSVETIIGLEENTEELIINDRNLYDLLNNFIGDKNYVYINKNTSNFYKLPPYFIAENIQSILIVNVITENAKGMSVFCYKSDQEIKEYQMMTMKIMVKRMAEIIDNHLKFKRLSSSYVDILKMLARILDNLSVNSIGYCDLMYRYSTIIAKELKLSEEETKNIALAAYLSNIGIIGLSEDLLHKKGKYSEVEYEMMKLHCEVGASLIEATIANKEVASIIRYHHERIDGFGYPQGLKGEEIPIGSKILAVVQTFLAKIQQREYRTALPFEQALKQLKTAGGTQLDERCVNALIKWFERKQNKKLNSPQSLGSCWEMRCSPENVCIGCPAYKNYNNNCWENKSNNCKGHGNTCDSCFVRTEFMYRVNKKSN